MARDPKTRGIFEIEYRTLPIGDAPARWVSVKGRGVFDTEGRCVRMSGTAIDVTKRRQAEQKLRESEEQLRLATEHAEIGMWDVDNVTGTLFWPPRVKAMFGISPETPVSMEDFYGGLHPEDREGVSAAYVAASDPGLRALYDVEYRTVGKEDGLVRWVHAKGRGIFDDSGRCLRVIGTAIEITRRKEIEQQIRELNETLERRVAERTVALEKSEAQIRRTEQALQQAQKMEAIGNLTGGIAHDFNNLLQGVAGSLDLIRRKPEDIERVRRWAEAGLQAAQRGAKLTAQLLAFSRAQKLEMRPVDVSSLLLGMRELLDRTLGPTVRVRFDLDPQATIVIGDETQLELAVLNLAINARDAMPAGGDLLVAARQSSGAEVGLLSGHYIELSVTDTGAGMPADVAARAFDPFLTTKDVGKGTGLGLSQVYGMARQAGGIARIRSEPSRGTTVSIYLPLSERPPQASTAGTEDAEGCPPPVTILVIDDDRDVRRFLADSLDSFGYAVLQAQDGPDGLEMLERYAADLVIVDYAMPGMTGAEVVRKIRNTRPQLPVIFASGYADTSALDNVSGDAPVLRKPFRVGELQQAVRTALRR